MTDDAQQNTNIIPEQEKIDMDSSNLSRILDEELLDDIEDDVEPGELPSVNEGNSDITDMNVLESILGNDDDAKDEFDQEINGSAKKDVTTKAKKGASKRKGGKKKVTKKSTASTASASTKGATGEVNADDAVTKSDSTAKTTDTETESPAKKTDGNKTQKKSKEKQQSTSNAEATANNTTVATSTALPKTSTKVVKKKKAAVKSTAKKETVKKAEEKTVTKTESTIPESETHKDTPTVNETPQQVSKEADQKPANSEPQNNEIISSKASTVKLKKEKPNSTAERKRKASEQGTSKDLKLRKSKEIKTKVEKVDNTLAEDDAKIETGEEDDATMQVVDDVDLEYSDQHSNYSRASSFSREYSRSPSFTESMSGSFTEVTLSGFSGSGSSPDSFERELENKGRRRRKHTEGEDREAEEKHKEFIDNMLKGARYFIIKSNNHENVTLSKAKGVWATPPANERKLNEAYKHSTNVILVFSVKESGRFQGFARLSSDSRHDGNPVPWVLPPGFDRRILGGTFKVDWLNRKEVSFSKCANLRNPWNENKEVKICRDGQELEPSVGEVLCRMFEDDLTIDLTRIKRHLKRPHRPSGDTYRRERFSRGGYRGDIRGRGRSFRGGSFRGERGGRFPGRRARGGFPRGSGRARGRGFHDNSSPRGQRRHEDRYEHHSNSRRPADNSMFSHHHHSSRNNRSRSPPDYHRRSDRESRDKRHKDRVKEFLKDDRSKYGIREETLLHGSYSDYVREFQRQKELESRGSSSYYPSSSSSYHVSSTSRHSYDANAAFAEEFIRRTRR